MNGPAPRIGTAVSERVYTAPDGISIEYFFYPLEGSDRCVLFWPGMGVDARLYRFRPAEFNARGYSALAINPRNHGKSGGQISRSEAVADFLGIVASLKISGSRLDVIGHSAGCDAVLRLCDTGLAVGRIFLVSPILTPRDSIVWMYRNDSILELLDIFSAKTGARDAVYEALSGSEWLDRGYWDAHGMRAALDSLSETFLLGRFLEEYFVDGFSALPELARQAHRSRIILPSHDRCFPVEETRAFGERHGIPATTLPEAHDHFFVGAWPRVWGLVAETLDLHAG